MGEQQAIFQISQINFSKKGWGAIKPDQAQGYRWLVYNSSRGDAAASAALRNLRTTLLAQQNGLKAARQTNQLYMPTETRSYKELIKGGTDITNIFGVDTLYFIPTDGKTALGKQVLAAPKTNQAKKAIENK